MDKYPFPLHPRTPQAPQPAPKPPRPARSHGPGKPHFWFNFNVFAAGAVTLNWALVWPVANLMAPALQLWGPRTMTGNALFTKLMPLTLWSLLVVWALRGLTRPPPDGTARTTYRMGHMAVTAGTVLQLLVYLSASWLVQTAVALGAEPKAISGRALWFGAFVVAGGLLSAHRSSPPSARIAYPLTRPVALFLLAGIAALNLQMVYAVADLLFGGPGVAGFYATFNLGLLFVALFGVVGLVQVVRGKLQSAVRIVAMTWPAGLLVVALGHAVVRALG
jgi:hypothetical protein